jgi:hypothetical protein
MVNRLAPLTHGGVQPRVTRHPSPRSRGHPARRCLTVPLPTRRLAGRRAAGTFPVPVAIDIKGAPAYQITQAAGVDAGQTGPTSIGFISSDRTLAGATTDAVTDEELRQRISGLR